MPKAKNEKEITSEQTTTKEPITTDVETNRLFDEGDIDDLVNDSPIVSGQDKELKENTAKQVEEETTEQAATEQAKKEETNEKKEESTEQAEQSQKTEEEKASEQEPDQVIPEKVKIGDREVPPEEVALWESEFKKKAEWEERNRNISAIASNLSTEEIQAAISVVSGDRKLPDQSAELADSIIAEILGDKPIKIKDDDGEYEIDVTDKVKENVREAVKATLSRVAPVLDKAKEEIESSQRKAVSTFIGNFMDKHPEYKIVVPENTPIDIYMDRVDKSGPTHPDYASLARFKVLNDAAKRMGYVGADSLEKAYTFLYGKHEGKVLTAEEKTAQAEDTQTKILKKQEKISQEKLGGQVETKDDIDLILDEVEDPGEKALKELMGL